MLDKKRVLLCVLCAGACAWFYLTLFLVEGGTHISDAVDNNCDHWRGCTLGGDVGSTLRGGTILCICGSTFGGGAGLWADGCAGGIDVCSSCPSVYCISCVTNLGNHQERGLIVGYGGGGGGAV